MFEEIITKRRVRNLIKIAKASAHDAIHGLPRRIYDRLETKVSKLRAKSWPEKEFTPAIEPLYQVSIIYSSLYTNKTTTELAELAREEGLSFVAYGNHLKFKGAWFDFLMKESAKSFANKVKDLDSIALTSYKKSPYRSSCVYQEELLKELP